VQILEQLVAARIASPTPLAESLGVERGLVSYHMRQLERLAVVTLHERTKSHGFPRHYYRLVDREAAILALEHAGTLARLSMPTRARIDPRTARGLIALGHAMRELREAQGVSVSELARRTNLMPVSLERIEGGDADPQMSTVAQVAAGLGVTLIDVLRAMR
jgi:DNA-binding XRE family transcriptional regulator